MWIGPGASGEAYHINEPESYAEPNKMKLRWANFQVC